MYVITGATGHTGNEVAEKLLAKGEQVRVVGRSAKRLEPFVRGRRGFRCGHHRHGGTHESFFRCKGRGTR